MDINEALYIKSSLRTKAIGISEGKRAELHSLLPRIAEIDEAIELLPLKAIGGSIEELRRETESLLAERERILLSAGYAADYDSPKFECKECNDSGYKSLKICECVKKLMAKSSYTESTLAGGLKSKTFEAFSLEYYKGEELKKAEGILNICKKYASDFPACGNIAGMIFFGGTGLGKTHLSAAIGNVVSSKGIITVYESASRITDIFDRVRFNRADDSERKRFEQASLLIIDDLGTENITGYSVSVISELIDTRLVNGRQTIINTNLTPDKLKKIYGDRVFSRLLGEYRVIQFTGGDIRMKRTIG